MEFVFYFESQENCKQNGSKKAQVQFINIQQKLMK